MLLKTLLTTQAPQTMAASKRRQRLESSRGCATRDPLAPMWVFSILLCFPCLAFAEATCHEPLLPACLLAQDRTRCDAHRMP